MHKTKWPKWHTTVTEEGVSGVYVSLNLYISFCQPHPNPFRELFDQNANKSIGCQLTYNNKPADDLMLWFHKAQRFSGIPAPAKQKDWKTRDFVQFDLMLIMSHSVNHLVGSLWSWLCARASPKPQPHNRSSLLVAENPCNSLSFNFLLFESVLLFMKYRIGSSETEPREQHVKIVDKKTERREHTKEVEEAQWRSAKWRASRSTSRWEGSRRSQEPHWRPPEALHPTHTKCVDHPSWLMTNSFKTVWDDTDYLCRKNHASQDIQLRPPESIFTFR